MAERRLTLCIRTRAAARPSCACGKRRQARASALAARTRRRRSRPCRRGPRGRVPAWTAIERDGREQQTARLLLKARRPEPLKTHAAALDDAARSRQPLHTQNRARAFGTAHRHIAARGAGIEAGTKRATIEMLNAIAVALGEPIGALFPSDRPEAVPRELGAVLRRLDRDDIALLARVGGRFVRRTRRAR